MRPQAPYGSATGGEAACGTLWAAWSACSSRGAGQARRLRGHRAFSGALAFVVSEPDVAAAAGVTAAVFFAMGPKFLRAPWLWERANFRGRPHHLVGQAIAPVGRSGGYAISAFPI